MRMELYGCRLGEWYTYNVSIGTSCNEHDTYLQAILINNKLFIFFAAAGLAQPVVRMTAEREAAGSIPGARPILMVLK